MVEIRPQMVEIRPQIVEIRPELAENRSVLADIDAELMKMIRGVRIRGRIGPIPAKMGLIEAFWSPSPGPSGLGVLGRGSQVRIWMDPCLAFQSVSRNASSSTTGCADAFLENWRPYLGLRSM